MSDNEEADRRRPRRRARKPLSKQNQRSPNVANHIFEPIEDVPVPQSAAGVVDRPPKPKKRPRPTYESEDDDDMPAREQPPQRTTTLPPHNTWDSLFNERHKVPLPDHMTNEEFGQWHTAYLNSKDKHIAYVERRVNEEMNLSGEYAENLFQMHEEIIKLQWHIVGTDYASQKMPISTVHLREPWANLRGLVLNKIGWAAETLESINAEITALKEQQKNEIASQLQAKNDRIAALEAQIAEQKDEMSVQLQAKNDRIAALEAQIADQTEARKADTADSEQSIDLLDKTNSICPPGLRTPSAGDITRRLEAEELCERLTSELGSLHRSMSGLKETYEHSIATESFTTTDDWGTFEEHLNTINIKAKEALRVNGRTVYNEAMGRSADLVTDLHQMERKEISSRNDINKILNLIEQHGQQCDGPPIFGKHTVYPDFLPKKDPALRGGG
jgi:hypothetical protein